MAPPEASSAKSVVLPISTEFFLTYAPLSCVWTIFTGEEQMNDAMKAVRIQNYGGPDVLRVEEVPMPRPGADEILVRVNSAGVNPVDYKIREGMLKKRLSFVLPGILGWDLSGVVVETGRNVTELKKGDEVYGLLNLSKQGTYAEFALAHKSEVVHKPTGIDHDQAAAIPLAALTAWQMLFEAAHLKPGQRVLVHAAAGGVGTFAIQLAKWKGAYVIGTASSQSHQLLRELGADELIDYRTTRFEDVVKDVDIVLDTLGGDTQQRSWGVLKKGGIQVSIVEPPSQEVAAQHGVKAAYVFVETKAEQLRAIAALVNEGKVKPIISAVLSLDEVRHAHQLIEAGHTHGKIVLRVADLSER